MNNYVQSSQERRRIFEKAGKCHPLRDSQFLCASADFLESDLAAGRPIKSAACNEGTDREGEGSYSA
jgi:hypothetical protein